MRLCVLESENFRGFKEKERKKKEKKRKEKWERKKDQINICYINHFRLLYLYYYIFHKCLWNRFYYLSTPCVMLHLTKLCFITFSKLALCTVIVHQCNIRNNKHISKIREICIYFVLYGTNSYNQWLHSRRRVSWILRHPPYLPTMK